MSKAITSFVAGSTLPAHLQKGSGLGNENVGSNIALPRLDIIQALSPQKQKSSPKFIDGAQEGHIFDSLNGALYDNVFLVNLFFDTSFAIFKKRAHGGGFEGNFDSTEACLEHLKAMSLDPNQYDVVESAVHKCLMLDAEGNPKQPVLIYMSGSKMKVSHKWNYDIQMNGQGADRFATVWTLSTVEEVNKRNQPYHNYRVDFAGFAGEELYNEARSNYFAMKGEAEPAAH